MTLIFVPGFFQVILFSVDKNMSYVINCDIVITIAAMLHVFVRYLLYLLFLQCLYPGVKK